MYLEILEPTFLIAGVVIYLTTLGLFLRRTGEYMAVLKFWDAEIAYSYREFVVNRVGLVIMFMGIALRVFNHL